MIGLTIVSTGALHAAWNAIAKQLEDRLLTLALIGIPMTGTGAAMLMWFGFPPKPASWLAIASAGVHVAYDLALMNSYRLGALNHVYPIARGISPLAVTAGAYLFVNERLAALPSIGITVLALGLISLVFSAGVPSRAEVPAVSAAVVTGLTIASYSVIDGVGVRHAATPFAYTGLMFLLFGPVFPVVAMLRRPPSCWRQRRVVLSGSTAGVLSVGAYAVVLWTQTKAPLAVVAALRETSVIFAALIGALFLNERFGARRTIAAVAVAAGIVLIGA